MAVPLYHLAHLMHVLVGDHQLKLVECMKACHTCDAAVRTAAVVFFFFVIFSGFRSAGAHGPTLMFSMNNNSFDASVLQRLLFWHADLGAMHTHLGDPAAL